LPSAIVDEGVRPPAVFVIGDVVALDGRTPDADDTEPD
jgi:hypothetical protein